MGLFSCKKEEKMNEVSDIRYEERTVPWTGLGTDISRSRNVEEALSMARLDWRVVQRPMNLMGSDERIPGYYANVRETDDEVLGIVGKRYSIVQNGEAFSFMDELVSEGVSFQMAGSFRGGRGVWVLAKLPKMYFLSGDKVEPYIVFINSHDGSGGVRVAMTPIRVYCSNMLNLSMKRAQRTWSVRHSGDIKGKLTEARDTLFRASYYMEALKDETNSLSSIIISDDEAEGIVADLIPVTADMGERMQENRLDLRADILSRYHEAPDLDCMDKSGLRLLHAISDHATHFDPVRRTDSFRENLFARSLNGLPLIDRAKELILAA